jgi:hypothetical protein
MRLLVHQKDFACASRNARGSEQIIFDEPLTP